MKILCYDCFSGISGDMNLAALIDLGVPVKHLRDELGKLPVKGYQLAVTREKRKGIEGTMVDVALSPSAGSMTLSANNHQNSRNWKNIKELISGSELSDYVKELSLGIFSRVAKAEAKIHGVEEENVHFHEVGALDSIVDIVGAAICIDYLKPDKILSTPPQLGGGFVKCEHGLLPVPAPATQEILSGIPVKTGLVNVETTTPTGAAILATTVHQFVQQFDLILGKTGYGIGHRELEIPNVLRVFWAEPATGATAGHLIMECNIDDMNPEWYDHVMEKLFEAGAEDVYLTPMIMKKNRPGILLSVLCVTSDEEKITDILYRETTTLGIRRTPIAKDHLERKITQIQISGETVHVKLAFREGKLIRWKAEHDDCRNIARKQKRPLREIYDEVAKIMSGNNSLT